VNGAFIDRSAGIGFDYLNLGARPNSRCVLGFRNGPGGGRRLPNRQTSGAVLAAIRSSDPARASILNDELKTHIAEKERIANALNLHQLDHGCSA
jgi:hypothetical protein